MSPSPRSKTTNVRFWGVLLGLLFAITIIVPVVLAFWPRVTAANYARINIGMPMQDVEKMLGPHRYDYTEYGIIGKTGAYVTNGSQSDQEKLDRGYQLYRRLHWISPEITITVIIDSNGVVATRYRSDGQGDFLFSW
ncbi:hypothetical protein SH528x_002940 [Novipirellula sp. SH528]|uniref:hypothetical protein n=1 Tax=Novipirellula sp. SH528 TaxID=3454466 RepID=UPI003F9ECFCA